MSTCFYTRVKQDGFETEWRTECDHKMVCEVPNEVGISFAPLPTDGGHKFCSFCGKAIKLSDDRKLQVNRVVEPFVLPFPKDMSHEDRLANQWRNYRDCPKCGREKGDACRSITCVQLKYAHPTLRGDKA